MRAVKDSRANQERLRLADLYEDRCPECRGEIVDDEDTREGYCEDCGLVVVEYLSPTSDAVVQATNPSSTNWRRKAASYVTHDSGMGSSVGRMNKFDVSVVSRDQSGRLQRAQTWHSTDDRARTLKIGLRELHRLAARLDVSDEVHEYAANLLHAASEADLFPGHSVEAFSSACLYGAAYVHNAPRTYETVAAVSGCGISDIKQAHKRLKRAEDVPLRPPAPDIWPRYGPRPRDLVPRFAAEVAGEIDEEDRGERDPQVELETHAKAVLQVALEAETILSNRTAKALAAGAVYVAAEYASLPVTQENFSATIPVSHGTLSKAASDLRDALD